VTADNTKHRPASHGPLAGAITEPSRDVALRKTAIRLADGRELIYFDEPGRPPRTTPDRRQLSPPEVGSELRLDPLTDEWIIIASHRQDRTHLPPSDACPLCPSSPGKLTEIPEDDYDVVVFENRFPSLASMPVDGARLAAPTRSLVDRRPAAGRCEVVCFSADHEASFAKLTPARVRTIMDAWADRHRALSALPGVRQVFPFENRGREVGVTLSHPHGQIYAYPFVTPRTRQMLETARRYHDRTGRNLFADVLRAEVRAGERIVRQSRHWTAFVPSAARWPIEVHLYPNRVVHVLSDLTGAERDDFAEIYLHVLEQIDGLYGVPVPYIAGWYQAPNDTPPQHSYLHLRFTSPRRAADKLKFLAGSESAMGVYVNDVAPEQIAHRLRSSI
jgi:UDPglucose--hexose-1-phosphate uridylyltransferase